MTKLDRQYIIVNWVHTSVVAPALATCFASWRRLGVEVSFVPRLRISTRKSKLSQRTDQMTYHCGRWRM